MIVTDWSRHPHFTERNFACQCCGEAPMDTGFMRRMEVLCTTVGEPLRISSGYRCTKHNKAVGGGPAHTTGRAADILCSGRLARKIVTYAHAFTGIGVSQRGAHESRFIHLDTLEADEFEGVPRPWLFSY